VVSLADKVPGFGKSFRARDVVSSGTPVAAIPAKRGAFLRTTLGRIASETDVLPRNVYGPSSEK